MCGIPYSRWRIDFEIKLARQASAQRSVRGADPRSPNRIRERLVPIDLVSSGGICSTGFFCLDTRGVFFLLEGALELGVFGDLGHPGRKDPPGLHHAPGCVEAFHKERLEPRLRNVFQGELPRRF